MDLLGILGSIGFDLNVFIFNLINFGIVIFVIKKYFFEKIQDTLEERQKIAENTLIKEEEAKKILDNAKVDARIIIKKATFDASHILNKAKDDAEKLHKDLSIKYQTDHDAKTKRMIADVNLQKKSLLDSFKIGVKNSFTTFLEDFLTKKAGQNANIIPEAEEYTNNLNLPNEKSN